MNLASGAMMSKMSWARPGRDMSGLVWLSLLLALGGPRAPRATCFTGTGTAGDDLDDEPEEEIYEEALELRRLPSSSSFFFRSHHLLVLGTSLGALRCSSQMTCRTPPLRRGTASACLWRLICLAEGL